MVDRVVSVGDDLTLPESVLVADVNLPSRLGSANLDAAYAAKQYPALGALAAGLVTRATTTARVVFLGSSTTAGYLATAEQRYVYKLLKHMQAAYPSLNGTETNILDLADGTTYGTGVHGYNGGISGTTAANYCTDAMVTQIAARKPIMVMHMVGSNDYGNLVPVATYKANVLNRINAIRASFTGPLVQVLVHQQERLNVFAWAAPWADYGKALRELADADRENLAFIDLSEPYRAAGVKAGGTDPLDLIDPDQVHQTPTGHTFMADLLRVRLNINTATLPAATAATATGARFTSDTFSGGDSADINARTTDAGFGGAFRAWESYPANGYTIVGGKLNPGTNTGGVAMFAGIKGLSPDMEISAIVTVTKFDFHLEARRAAVPTNVQQDTYRLYVTAADARLRKRVAGVSTDLSTPYSYTAGDRLGMRCKGNQISLLINGVVKQTVTDSALAGAGYWGTSGNATVEYTLDNLTLDVV